MTTLGLSLERAIVSGLMVVCVVLLSVCVTGSFALKPEASWPCWGRPAIFTKVRIMGD
jgi:hypothetical protein